MFLHNLPSGCPHQPSMDQGGNDRVVQRSEKRDELRDETLEEPGQVGQQRCHLAGRRATSRHDESADGHQVHVPIRGKSAEGTILTGRASYITANVS